MTERTYKNDMTMMLVMHDALRRELERMARITARTDDDPRHMLQTALGWELFKNYLRVHHNAEDDALWPPIRQAIGERADDLVVIDAMEAEHATVDPGLNAIDAALADRESGPERLGAVFDRLVGGLGGHLTHEEKDALPLIDAYATPEVMQRFGLAHSSRIGAGVSRYLPWLLDSASAERTSAALATLPDPVRLAYLDEWQPAYAALNLWAARQRPLSPGSAATE
jgi:hemerythrin-like domain-containing protein